MLKLHYSTILAQRGRMEALKLEICDYLNCESHIHLHALHKVDAEDKKLTQFWMLHGVVTCSG